MELQDCCRARSNECFILRLNYFLNVLNDGDFKYKFRKRAFGGSKINKKEFIK